MARKGVDTNTLILLGGMGLLGVGMFFGLRRPSPAPVQQQQAQMAASEIANALNVQNQTQYQEMYSSLLKALNKSGGDMDKALRDQQLIAGWVNMGIGAATQITGAIASLAKAF